MLARRGFIAGLAAALCAPAVIRTPGLLMPVKPLVFDPPFRVFDYMAECHAWSDGILPAGTLGLALARVTHRAITARLFHSCSLRYTRKRRSMICWNEIGP